MDFSLTGTVLTRDLFSADGRLVASRGEIVDLLWRSNDSSAPPRTGLIQRGHAEEGGVAEARIVEDFEGLRQGEP